MSRARLLDLFCGAGGAAVGYRRAGFTEIVGVDIKPQPRYPFEFVQADALEFLATVKPGEYDAIHASPPCQGYSRMRHLPWMAHKTWPLLIDPTRKLLQRLGIPWVIENVADAPLDGLILCGQTFGLKVYRHRRFESSHLLLSPPHEPHREVIGGGRMLGNRLRPSPSGMVSVFRGNRKDTAAAGRAMGIDWMLRRELCEAIPPAYTEWLGRQLIGALA